MLEHHHPVAGGKRDGAARSALADDARHHRCRQPQAGPNGRCNRLGLTAFLGPAAGIGTCGIDKAQNRQTKPPGKLHQTRRLAVAFRPRHAEITLDAFLGVASLFGSHHHDSLTSEARHAADDGVILGIVAVAGKRREILEQLRENGTDPWPLRMPRNLNLFPGAKLFIGLFQLALDAGLKLANLVGDVDAAV